jgi:hypothetical protein
MGWKAMLPEQFARSPQLRRGTLFIDAMSMFCCVENMYPYFLAYFWSKSQYIIPAEHLFNGNESDAWLFDLRGALHDLD